jgi:autophagy-related protein 2
VNVFPLEGVEVDLKRCKLTGLEGWASVGVELATLWCQDIAKTQAHRYLTGVQPIRSLVNVGTGVADLVLMPITQYRRDGRLAKGVQKGVTSFVRSVALEAANVTTRLALGAQKLLESVDTILTPAAQQALADGSGSSSSGGGGGGSSSSRRSRAKSRRQQLMEQARVQQHFRPRRALGVSRLSNQPANHREGLQQAYSALSRGFQTAAHAMVVIPSEDFHRYGARTAVKSVLKAVPGAVLRPMIGASEAVAKALLGVQNTIDPLKKRDADARYKKGK